MFTDLDKAKSEARLAAGKIQRGLAANNDLSTRDREIFHAARKLLQPFDVPMLAAIEEYVRARAVLKDLPLVTAAQEFMRQNEGVKPGVTVPEVCAEMIAAKSQDSLSRKYINQLKSDLNAFSTHFPGPILHVKSQGIDRWFRGLGYTGTTRNNMRRSVKGLFKFAQVRNYLPKAEITEASRVSKLKVPPKDNEIYTPDHRRRWGYRATRTARIKR